MRTKLFGAVLANTVGLLLTATFAGHAGAVETSWGRLNLSYLNYNCIGGSCRIAGNIQDRVNGDGCVYMRVWQQAGGQGYPQYTRTCTGAYVNYDFYLPANLGLVNSVELAREDGAVANAWHR